MREMVIVSTVEMKSLLIVFLSRITYKSKLNKEQPFKHLSSIVCKISYSQKKRKINQLLKLFVLIDTTVRMIVADWLMFPATAIRQVSAKPDS